MDNYYNWRLVNQDGRRQLWCAHRVSLDRIRVVQIRWSAGTVYRKDVWAFRGDSAEVEVSAWAGDYENLSGVMEGEPPGWSKVIEP